MLSWLKALWYRGGLRKNAAGRALAIRRLSAIYHSSSWSRLFRHLFDEDNQVRLAATSALKAAGFSDEQIAHAYVTTFLAAGESRYGRYVQRSPNRAVDALNQQSIEIREAALRLLEQTPPTERSISAMERLDHGRAKQYAVGAVGKVNLGYLLRALTTMGASSP